MKQTTYNKRRITNNSGQAAVIAVLFLVTIASVMTFSASATALKEESISRSNIAGKNGYFLSESGQEDAVYRIKTGKPISGSVALELNGGIATTTIVDVTADVKEVTVSGNFGKNTRKTLTGLERTLGTSFFHGVQSGEGGFNIKNSAFVDGNVFSSGPIEAKQGEGRISGNVISAGAFGVIDGIDVTGSAYAATIKNSVVGGDAYYQTISNSTISGTQYPNSIPQATTTLPITDETITELEALAEAGGVISAPCPYEIKENVSLGPVKINCDVKIKNNADVTLEGMVWVVGNITIENSNTIRLSTSLGNVSAGFIADNPNNRITSSIIDVHNSVSFVGSGTDGSYVALISQNKSAEIGGSVQAIDLKNSVFGDLLAYAGHGEVNLENSVDLKEVAGYKVSLENSVNVVYETGLAHVLFTAGPSSGYRIIDWKEIE